MKRFMVSFLAAAMLITAVPVQPVSVQAATTTVTVSTVNTSSAQKVVNKLNVSKAFYVKFTGTKSAAKKKYKALQKQIGQINEYAVQPQYSSIKKSGNGYKYYFNKTAVSEYQHSVSFWKKIVEETKKNRNENNTLDNDGYLDDLGIQYRAVEEAAKYDTIEAFEKAHNELCAEALLKSEEKSYDPTQYPYCEYSSYEEYYIDNEIAKDAEDILNSSGDLDIKRIWTLAHTKFCDLSDAMKVWVLSASYYFGAGKGKDDFGMEYSDIVTKEGKNWDTMKGLDSNNAYGVCSHYAKAEQLALKQIGIKAAYKSASNHAWTELDVKNADGEMLHLAFDYGLGGGRTVKEVPKMTADTYAKIY